MRSKIILFLVAILLVSSNSMSYADQMSVVIPASVDPGLINKTNANELLDNKNVKTNLPTGKTEAKTLNKTEVKQRNLVYNPKFNLKKIVFSGNTIYSTEKLEKLCSNLIGKEVFIDDIVDIADKITKMYQKDGYITSSAYLPPQKVANGQIQINISENKIGQVHVTGNKWVSTNYLQKNIIGTTPKNNIFNVNNLNNSLQDLNQKKYIKGKIEIIENDNPELNDIVLQVKDRFPIGFNVNYDNEGRSLVGVQRSVMLLSYDNLTGHGDSIYGGTVLADRTVGAVAGYKLPLNAKGTMLNMGYSYSNVRLGQNYKENRIKGTSTDYNIGLSHPLYRGKDTQLTGDISLDMRNANTIQRDVDFMIAKYNARVLRSGFNLDKLDSQGRWASRLETSFGLPLLGASETNVFGESGYGIATGKFFKFNSYNTRIQRLPKNSIGIIRFDAQYSPDALLAPEQMQIGGVGSVRGYEPGLVLGDYGFNGTLEVRSSVPFLKEILPGKIKNFNDRVKIGYFYDWGFTEKIHDRHSANYNNFLQSVGVGMHFYLTDYLAASFNLGIPLGTQRYDTHDARLHFLLSTNVDKMFFRTKNEEL